MFNDVCAIVEQTKNRVAVNVNAEQNVMFWLIGKRINEDVLDNKRASYGKQIVSTLSTQLPDKKVLQSQLRRQLESAKNRMEQISEIDLLNEKQEE